MRIQVVLALVFGGLAAFATSAAFGQTHDPSGATPPSPPAAGVQAPHQPGAPAALTRAMVCNDLGAPFGLAVDGRRFETVAPGGCRMAQLAAGTHLFTPRGRPDTGPWFAHPAWQVDIPVEGAVLRFGLQGNVANLIEVLKGLPAPPAQAEPVPENEPIYLAPANEVSPQQTVALSPWQLCAPAGEPLSVMVDGSPAFSLLGGACGAAYLPYGYHTFSYMTPGGGYYCPPYVGHAGPHGGRVGATPGGVVPVPPRWRGFPLRNPTRVDGSRVRSLVPQPRGSIRPMNRVQANTARMQARRSATASTRIGTARSQPWPSSGPAWGRHRRNNQGWVVGPSDARYRPRNTQRWTQRPQRAWRTPSGRIVYPQRSWRRPAPSWRGGTPRPMSPRVYRPAVRGPAYRGMRGGTSTVRSSTSSSSPSRSSTSSSPSRPSGGGRSGGGRR